MESQIVTLVVVTHDVRITVPPRLHAAEIHLQLGGILVPTGIGSSSATDAVFKFAALLADLWGAS